MVISGPSGVGKTTVVRQLYGLCPRLVASVSATTRPPRPDEQDGRDYHFLSPEEFARRREAGEFVECCEVFGRGHWYGTLKSEVTPRLAAGKWVVLEIDVQGTLAVLEQYPDALTIFIRPESLEELEQRLRGLESQTRLKTRYAAVWKWPAAKWQSPSSTPTSGGEPLLPVDDTVRGEIYEILKAAGAADDDDFL